jgi:ABC-type glycerol-3-phosphate transport system permease component
MGLARAIPNFAVQEMPIRRKDGLPWRRILLHATIIFFCLVILLPLFWILLISLKSEQESYTSAIFPQHWDFSNYSYVFTHIPSLVRNMVNSIVVTSATVFLTSLCAVLAGFALVHLRVPGRAVVISLLVGTLFFPARLISIIAIFEIQSQLKLLNNVIGLILPYVTLNLAISVLIMRGIFEQISPEIVDAAKIDGCGTWKTLTDVMVPLVRNGIVVLVIVNFVTSWGEYLLAKTLTTDQLSLTMPVVLASAFQGIGQWTLPHIAAVYVTVIAPGIVAFAIAQRWYMRGLLEGALKV